MLVAYKGDGKRLMTVVLARVDEGASWRWWGWKKINDGDVNLR